MKSTVMLLLALAAAAAGGRVEPLRFYHSAVGIPQAERIRQHEQALGSDVASRIIGGEPVAATAHPYLGGLLILLTNGNESVCGASLLSNTKTVTAAHCWWDGKKQGRQLTVVYGSNRLYSGGTRIKTDKVEMHPNYNIKYLTNDIAIITHAQVTYSRTINRIALTSSNSNFVGQLATAAGYGKVGQNISIGRNQELREVTMQVISNEACAAAYAKGWVISSTLCTNSTGRGICHGDSGGPLTIGSGSDRVLIGVSSFVSEYGCEQGYPSGFVRVSEFRAWIRERIF
ncbi:hypothetical protein ABMA28_015329 [Loxostege sticticalis]|uniref:Peptidase S1 domain-containing protein n=1 Tax=Loxostege sticticalis TaxID=481309 RepID=A0ABD0T9G4_LOXSC